ncbi:MAG: hypothetical protein GWO88_01340, partial [Planctomycetia bacterium]|nr:hypothetical protein [Planctomycetia bacterium]
MNRWLAFRGDLDSVNVAIHTDLYQGETMSTEKDPDPRETREWLEALDSVIEFEGTDRAH